MKKFLLSCCLALGIGANAQFTANYNFSDLNTPGFTWFGAGGPSTTACSSPQSFFNQFSTTQGQAGGPVIDFSEWAGGQTNNGNKIDVSIKYRKAVGFVGTLNLIYAEYQPTTNNWSLTPFAQVAVANAAINTCSTLTGVIPAGTLDPTKIYAIGAYFQRTGATTSVNFYYDDLIVSQETTSVPNCATIISPVQGGVVNSGSQVISWNTASGATAYKLTVGTTAGGSDIYNNTVTTTSQSVALPGIGATYYAKVVPTNANGDATGCTEINFKTCDGSSTVVTTTYQENFNLSALPSCWTNEATSGTSVWNFVTQNGNASITPKSAPYMAEFRTTTNGNKARLITAPLDITSLQSPTLKFNYANVNWDGDIDELRVYYKTSATGTWTQIGTNYTAENTAWKEVILALPNKSATYYVAFEATSQYARGLNLDDISIYNDATLAVSELGKVATTVYPNPFSDVLKISDVKGIKSVSINDVSGREVKTLAPTAELNLSSLKAGLYIVNLKMEDGSVKTFKAIKK